MKMKISDIKIGERHRKEMGDLKSLAASIVEIGLLQPIGVTHDNALIFGERRLRACRDILEREEIEVRVIDMPEIVVAENAENEVRKSFTASERVAIARAISDELGDRRGINQHTDEGPQNFADAKRGQETRDFAAKKAGFGNRETFRQAEAVVTTAEPELVEAMDRNVVSISAAHRAAKAPPEVQREVASTGGLAALERQREREQREAGAREPLELKYQTFADSVTAIANTGLTGEAFLSGAARGTVARCRRSAIAAIAALRPIAEVSSDDKTRAG